MTGVSVNSRLGWIHEFQSQRCSCKDWNYSLDSSVRRLGTADFASERFSLRTGDFDPEMPNRERAEKIEVGPRQRDEETHWYSWSFRVNDEYEDCVVEPDPSKAISGDTTFAQFLQEPGSRDEHDPSVMFGKKRDGAFRMRILPTFHHRNGVSIPQRDLISDEDFRGRWHDLVIQARWSSSNGFIKVWVNGSQEIEFSGQTCFTGGGDLYHKYGLYRPTHRENPDVSVWYAHLRRGDTRLHVDRHLLR